MGCFLFRYRFLDLASQVYDREILVEQGPISAPVIHKEKKKVGVPNFLKYAWFYGTQIRKPSNCFWAIGYIWVCHQRKQSKESTWTSSWRSARKYWRIVSNLFSSQFSFRCREWWEVKHGWRWHLGYRYFTYAIHLKYVLHFPILVLPTPSSSPTLLQNHVWFLENGIILYWKTLFFWRANCNKIVMCT